MPVAHLIRSALGHGARGATPSSRRPTPRLCRVLGALTVLVLPACGSAFSDAHVGDGEQLVSNHLYAVVVPRAAEQSENSEDRISLAWSAAGGHVTATVEQEDVTVLHDAGTLTRTPVTVAGAQVERLDADLRRLTAAETGERIRYRVAVNRLPLPAADRPTRIELELTAPASLSEADVQAFRDAAQSFLDRVQVRPG